MTHVATGNSGEYLVLSKKALAKLIEDEYENLVESLAVTTAELEVVRAERDDLLRRVDAVQSIWDRVKPRARRPSPGE